MKKIIKVGMEAKAAEIASAENLRIKELDGHIPLVNDGLVNENNIFRWYRVKDERDYLALNTAYGNTIRKPSVYPEIICVETAGQEAYQGDVYNYHLADCKKITIDFWKLLGYKCRIENSRETEEVRRKEIDYVSKYRKYVLCKRNPVAWIGNEGS